MGKIIKLDNLSKKIDNLKKNNKTVVHCHGVFDLLHIGHIKHLEKAKMFADVLVVTITPDEYVKKGSNRPAFNSILRMQALSSLKCVDYVSLNKWPTASKAIRLLRPNVYCKGQEYKKEINDLTGKISEEKYAIKSVKGAIRYTDEITFSSSKLLNQIDENLNINQKNYIKKIQSQNVFKNKKFLDQINNLRVLVIGETIIDKYSFCEVLGKSGKEPHLVLREKNDEIYLGGAAAVSRHVSQFCKSVTLLSAVGSDKKYSSFIRKSLPKNIKTIFLNKKNSSTIEKKRYLDYISKTKLFGIYSINDEKFDKVQENIFKKLISRKIRNYDVVIVSDYGHGLISDSSARLICNKSKFLALNAQVNSANVGYHSILKYKNIDCLIINETELRHELRDKNKKIELLILKLSKEKRIENLVVTRGNRGAILYNSKTKKFIYCPAFAVKVLDKVGAGDTMLGILSIFLKTKIDKSFSLFLASLASAQNVESIANKDSVDKIKLLKYVQYMLK